MTKLRVIQIIPSLNKGGAERIMLDISHELNKREDVELKIITLSSLNSYPELSAGLPIQCIPCKVNLSLWKKNQIDVSELQNAIEAFKTDVIHSHLFIGEIVSRSCYYPKAKWITHCHDNIIQLKKFSFGSLLKKEEWVRRFERGYMIERYKQNGGNVFLAISQDTYEYFNANMPDFKTIKFLNAVNLASFEAPYPRKPIQSDQPLEMVYTASFLKKKNQRFLLDVADVLLRRKQDFHITLLGEGECKNEVERAIEQKNLSSYFSLKGNVENVREYLDAANVYLHVAKYEPFGLAIVEAMATGLPVVMIDGKGNRDIFGDGKFGYLIQQGDHEKFADSIIELKTDSERYAKMSSEAIKQAKKFDIKSYTEALLEIYLKN